MKKTALWLGMAMITVVGLTNSVTPVEARDKYKVYLSMSYVGNDWQSEAQQMVVAMAKAHADELDLKI